MVDNFKNKISPDRNEMKLIVNTCVLFFIVSGLCQGILATKPQIIPAPGWKFIEDGVFQIEEGDELRIKCQGEGELQFSTQEITGNIPQSHHQLLIEPGTGIYTFIRPSTIPEDSGWYACAKKGIFIRNDEQTIDHPSEDISWIYVYVNSASPFAVMHDEDSPYVELIATAKGVIPCRPTSPGLKVILLKNYAPEPVGPNLRYDPKIGFIINHADGGENGMSVGCAVEDIDLLQPEYTLVVKNNDPLSNTDIKTEKWLQIGRGEDLTLRCNITVMKDTTLELDWKTPNSGAENRSSLKSSSVKTGDNVIRYIDLTIKNAVESDAGNYTCVGKGAVDTVRSSTNVTIVDPNKPFINWTVLDDKYSIVASENAEAAWQVHIHTFPPAKLDWYRDEILIENVGSDNSSKYSMTVEGIIHMYKITGLNISDNGNYTIRISTSNASDVIRLQVTVNVKPVNVIHNRSLLYKPGDTADIFCNATGSPRPDVTWTFSEWTPEEDVESTSPLNITSEAERRGDFSVLSSIKMPIRSMGNLTCKACNIAGRTDVTAPIFISDGDGFFGIVNRGLQPVTEGDNLTLICAASRFNYTNNIQWVLENSTGPEISDSRISIENDKRTNFTWQSILEIRDVKGSDAGNYSCQAVSIAGDNDTKIYDLVVYGELKPSFTFSNLNNSDIDIDTTKGQSAVNLTCFPEGRPKPEITWWKDGKPIAEGDNRHTLSSDNLTLFIPFFVQGKGGNFSCIAKNRLGSIERYLNIIVKGKPENTTMLVSLICVLIIIIIIVIIYMGIKVHRERVLRKELLEAGLTHFVDGALECLNPDLTVDDQAELLPYDKKWEFPRELLKIGKQLGSGAFGVVMKAEARGIIVEGEVTTVAVKMVRRSADPSYMRALSSELKIMIHLGQHLNVVNLLGACTKTILTKRELYVIVEYCRFGNLHNYLQRHRESFINQIDPATQKIDPNFGADLFVRSASIGSQNRYGPSSFSRSFSGTSCNSNSGINSGTELIDYRYGTEFGEVNMSPEGAVLSNNSVQPGWRSNYRGDYKDQNLKPIRTQDLLCWAWQVSRGMEYLSARNVLHGDLAARNILLADDNIVKICDFGLAKNMYKDDNYKKKGDGPLPIKWMAVESIRDRIFSTQSDIWSFGIVLWEFFTLARTPYPGMEAEKQYDRLIEGYRMEKPQYATEEIYDFMLNCWKEKPSLRPTFPELAEKIGSLLNENLKMHFMELNTPYMDMNTIAKQNGQNDYLTMMSSPNHDCPASPDPTSEGLLDSAYLSMSPSGTTSESGPFSPRSELEESHFTFPPLGKTTSTNSDSEDCMESVPIFKPIELNIEPIDIQQERVEFVKGRKDQTSIEKDSLYSNFTANLQLSNSNNPPYGVVKDCEKNLNAKDFEKNKINSISPIISGKDNYINMPQTKLERSKDTVDGFSNPNYVMMSKLEDDRQLV